MWIRISEPRRGGTHGLSPLTGLGILEIGLWSHGLRRGLFYAAPPGLFRKLGHY
jgi:hypothetical protein